MKSICFKTNSLGIKRRLKIVLFLTKEGEFDMVYRKALTIKKKQISCKRAYSGHQMQRANSLEKTLVWGKIEGRRQGSRGQDHWMASSTQWT